MPYKDPTVQRQYQTQWRAARRQPPRREPPRTLTAWMRHVQTLRITCTEVQQALQPLLPALQQQVHSRERGSRLECIETLQALQRMMRDATATLERLEQLAARLPALLPGDTAR